MSDTTEKGGGEADGARLLRLARRELLDVVLPALGGDERYRARLIANAMKIAARELESGAAFAERTAGEAGAFAEANLGTKSAASQEAMTAIRDALRSGGLDGSPALYRLLNDLTQRRRTLLG